MAVSHPHGGHVMLHQCAHSSKRCLRHDVSQEFVPLQGSITGAAPELLFDGDGFGFLSIGDGADMFDLSGFLQLDIVEAPDGSLGIVMGPEDRPHIEWAQNLDNSYTRFSLEFAGTGCNLNKVEVEAALFRRAKCCGSRLLWSLPSLTRLAAPDAKLDVGTGCRRSGLLGSGISLSA